MFGNTAEELSNTVTIQMVKNQFSLFFCRYYSRVFQRVKMLRDSREIEFCLFHELMNTMLFFRKLKGDPEADWMPESFEFLRRSITEILIIGIHSGLRGNRKMAVRKRLVFLRNIIMWSLPVRKGGNVLGLEILVFSGRIFLYVPDSRPVTP